MRACRRRLNAARRVWRCRTSITGSRPRIRWALDAQVLGQPRRPLRAVAAVLLAVAAVIAGDYLARSLFHPHGWALTAANGVLLVAGYGFLTLVAAFVYHSTKRTQGHPLSVVRLLRPSDLKILGLAWLAEYAGRFVVLAFIFAAHPAWRSQTTSNIHLRGHSTMYVVESALIAICVAPIVEEVLFRGIILQTLTQWWDFPPAAAASSLAFGLFHAYEAPTGASAFLLVVSISVFGLGQAILTRYTGNLSVPIAVHSLTNAVAVLVNLA